MTDKSLKNKAIKIKGKDYVLVSDRVLFFNENYPNGSILTRYEVKDDTYIVQATVVPDVDNVVRCFYGTSQATIGDGMVNKSAALENAETSAVGRALAMMGVGVLDSIASADEMSKATSSPANTTARFATPKQVEWIRREASKVSGFEHSKEIDAWVKDHLTLEPEKIPVFKVKDAIDKIISIGEEAQKRFDKKYEQTVKDVVAHVDDNTVINLDDLPY